MTLHRIASGPVLAVTIALAACTSSDRGVPPPEPRPGPQAALNAPAAPLSPSVAGPVLDANGACTGSAPTAASAIEPGIGECDLVRLKGKPPTDVLVGEGRSGREVQVLYNEPGAKELYFFVNNKLDRIVK